MSDDQKLLREFIQQIIKEEDFSMGGFDGGLINWTDASGLKSIFLDPFVDAFKQSAGQLKQVSRQAQTFGVILVKSVMSAILPFITQNYTKTFEKNKEDIANIKNEYSEVKARIDQTFNNPVSDVLFASFLYNPALFLTVKLAPKAPKAIGSLLSVISGGKIDPLLQKIAKKVEKSPKKTAPSQEFAKTFGSSIFNTEYFGESVNMNERLDENQGISELSRFLTGSKVLKMVLNSPTAKKMQNDAKRVIDSNLQDILQQAQHALKFNSIQDIEHLTGKKFKNDKLNSSEEQLIIKETRDFVKNFYITNLQNLISKAITDGVPKNHPIIQKYQSLTQQIKSM